MTIINVPHQSHRPTSILFVHFAGYTCQYFCNPLSCRRHLQESISVNIISRAEQSQGLLYKHLCHQLIDEPTISSFKKICFRRLGTSGLSTMIQTMLHRFRRFKISREIKLLYLFKCNCNFAGRIYFAYWWSCIRKSLRSTGIPRIAFCKRIYIIQYIL